MTRYDDLANLIRSLRFSANWTQSELAERAGIALMSVSVVENGRNTRWETLNSLAHALLAPVRQPAAPRLVTPFGGFVSAEAVGDSDHGRSLSCTHLC
jgi:transcriptional regulator with XRE-family HTH domain